MYELEIGLNTHSSHKLENIEPRKRSPEGNPGPPSPSEVIVFNNTNHTGGGGRNGQTSRSLPEVPQLEEIQRFLRDTWDRKMYEAKAHNLNVLFIPSEKDHISRDGFHTPGSSHPPTPKQRNSPQHTTKK